MPEISQKARQVLEYLTQRESSIPPSVREIGAAVGLKSPSTVHFHMKGLEEAGAVNMVSGMILDYRAFDTFGESNVLFAATTTVLILLHSRKRALSSISLITPTVR